MDYWSVIIGWVLLVGGIIILVGSGRTSRHIYFACSLHDEEHGPLPSSARKRYDYIADLLGRNGYSTYFPHREVFPREMTARQVNQHSEQEVYKAGIVIVDVTIQAFGPGMEMYSAQSYGISVILVAQGDVEVEPMIMGGAAKLIRFSTLSEELDKPLLKALAELTPPRRWRKWVGAFRRRRSDLYFTLRYPTLRNGPVYIDARK